MKSVLVFANFTELDDTARTNISFQPQQFLHSAVSASRPPCNINSKTVTIFINNALLLKASKTDQHKLGELHDN